MPAGSAGARSLFLPPEEAVITSPATAAAATADERLEWWEQQQSRRQQREAVQPVRAAAAAQLRAALSWVALACVIACCVLDDDLRSGAWAFAQVALLLLAWFAITRTRTISWRFSSGVFVAAVAWAALIALATPLIAGHLAEEALLAAPLAVVAVALPGRTRRFAVIDWLMIGCALGLGYQALELTAWALAGHRGAAVPGGLDMGTGGHSRYLLLAIGGVSTGLAIAIARHGARYGGRVALACRAVGVLLPLLALALLVGAHLRPMGELPLWLRTMRTAGSRSVVLTALIVLLVLAGLLMDTRRIRATDEPGTDRMPFPYSPAAAADRWTLAVTGPGNAGPGSTIFYTLTASVWAACCMVTYVVRDLLFVLGAHVRDAEEPAAQACSRGRAASTLTRVMRSESFRPLDPDDGGRRNVRAGGIVSLVLLTGAGVLLAGLGENAPGQWLGAARDGLADAPRTLTTAAAVAAGLTLAAMLVLVAGAPGMGLADGGARRLLLDRGRGAVSFTRTGPLGERLRSSTVPELALDALTTLVALVPAAVLQPLTGSAASGPARAIVAEFCAAPARLITRRRRQLSVAPDDTGAMTAVRTGSWDAASRRRWVDSRVTSRAYRITSADGRTSVPSEGLSLAADGVAMVEASHLHRVDASMLYEGLAPPLLAERLLTPFDDEMRRYATVIRDPHNPVSRLRLVVGSQLAGNLLGGRAREILGHDLDLLVIVDPAGD